MRRLLDDYLGEQAADVKPAFERMFATFAKREAAGKRLKPRELKAVCRMIRVTVRSLGD